VLIDTEQLLSLIWYKQLQLCRKGTPRSCADRYRAIAEADVVQAVAAMQKGDPKIAEDGAGDVSVLNTSCKIIFSRISNQHSPMTTR